MSEPKRDQTWSIVIRNAAEQATFDCLLAVVTKTLQLDWRGMPGEPDGEEIALDCAEALWRAGFRTTDAWRP